MVLSYPLRLACLIAVSMGLLHVAFELLLRACAPGVLRLLPALSLRQRERALYLVQLLPLVLALLCTALLCIPQYVSNETNLAPERVGWLSLLVAPVLLAWWGARFFTGGRILVRTMLFSRACRRANLKQSARPGQTPVVLGAGSTSRVALVGLLHPFIFISESLIEEGVVAPAALELVLEHERSHAAQHDNWKLFSLYCLPRLNLGVSEGKTWMQLWQNAAEWAADHDAVRGNSAHAFLLAETLVALARTPAANSPQLACTYLVSDQSELALRVEHLILATSHRSLPADYRLGAAVCGAVLVAAILLANLGRLLGDVPELLLHLG